MSEFNELDVFNWLATELATLTNVNKVWTGVPDAFETLVDVYLAYGPETIDDMFPGSIHREVQFFIGMGFRVRGAPADAEVKLGQTKQDLVRKFYREWRPTLSNDYNCENPRLDLSLATTPAYQPNAGNEYRIMPIMIVVGGFTALT